MHDPKPKRDVPPPPSDPAEEAIPGQADDLDRGTGKGASGGALHGDTGFTTERGKHDDLEADDRKKLANAGEDS